MRFVSIASGSSGNCIYVESENTHILVDAGISNKRIECGLNELGVKAAELDGILITHEHSDHIKGLGVLSRKHHVPIYGTKETLERIKNSSTTGEMPEEVFRPISADCDFCIKNLTIKPFSIHHDAANPVAYRVQHGKKSVAVVTDLGKYDQYTIDCLQGLDALLLESNHDVKMLQVGKYPYYLKRRILGDYGHLSNETAGHLLNYLLHDNLKGIFLGHLSQENNYEELAVETVKVEISMGDHSYKASDFLMAVAKRDAISEVITI